MNSLGSDISRCHSMSWRTQARRCFVFRGDVVAGLVFPVRGDAFFGDAVHLFGADLDFELVAAGRDESCVQ